MSTTAQYAAEPTLETAQVTTANTNRDGTGATVLVCSGPATAAGPGVGKRISRVTLSRAGTTSATVICFYISYDNGVTKRLFSEWPVPNYTASPTTAQAIAYEPDFTGMVLPGSTGGVAVQIYASTQVAATINITVESALL